MYQMYEITDETSLKYAIKDYQSFYSEERPRDRYNCKTSLEVRQEALASEIPAETSEMFRLIKYEDKREVFGFRVHSFSTFDRIKKYDEADNAESAEKSYSIDVGKTKRTINLYAVASTKFEIAF